MVCNCLKTLLLLGGLMNIYYNYTAIINPTVNSGKRLSWIEAPAYIAWQVAPFTIDCVLGMGATLGTFSGPNGKPILWHLLPWKLVLMVHISIDAQSS